MEDQTIYEKELDLAAYEEWLAWNKYELQVIFDKETNSTIDLGWDIKKAIFEAFFGMETYEVTTYEVALPDSREKAVKLGRYKISVVRVADATTEGKE